MLSSLMSIDGLHFLFRWLHVFSGVVWIGHLYYFNFVQGAYMAEADAGGKSQVLQKLVPRAMWWFRWGAMWTFLSGVIMLSIKAHVEGGMNMNSPYWINIMTGALMATLMFLNVWVIIWPRQKVIIANAQAVAGGAAANPAVAALGARSTVASRTNVLFSIPMILFMVSAMHLSTYPVTENSHVGLYWLLVLVVVGGIEANAIWGKTGPMTTIKGVITSGFVLTAVLLVLNAVTI
jgi:uncharacterized membrane protein